MQKSGVHMSAIRVWVVALLYGTCTHVSCMWSEAGERRSSSRNTRVPGVCVCDRVKIRQEREREKEREGERERKKGERLIDVAFITS